MALRLTSRALTTALDQPTTGVQAYHSHSYNQQQQQQLATPQPDYVGHSRISVDAASVMLPTDLSSRVKAASSFLHSEQLTRLASSNRGGGKVKRLFPKAEARGGSDGGRAGVDGGSAKGGVGPMLWGRSGSGSITSTVTAAGDSGPSSTSSPTHVGVGPLGTRVILSGGAELEQPPPSSPRRMQQQQEEEEKAHEGSTLTLPSAAPANSPSSSTSPTASRSQIRARVPNRDPTAEYDHYHPDNGDLFEWDDDVVTEPEPEPERAPVPAPGPVHPPEASAESDGGDGGVKLPSASPVSSPKTSKRSPLSNKSFAELLQEMVSGTHTNLKATEAKAQLNGSISTESNSERAAGGARKVGEDSTPRDRPPNGGLWNKPLPRSVSPLTSPRGAGRTSGGGEAMGLEGVETESLYPKPTRQYVPLVFEPLKLGDDDKGEGEGEGGGEGERRVSGHDEDVQDGEQRFGFGGSGGGGGDGLSGRSSQRVGAKGDGGDDGSDENDTVTSEGSTLVTREGRRMAQRAAAESVAAYERHPGLPAIPGSSAATNSATRSTATGVTPTPRWLTQADMKLANQRPFSPEPFLCPWELEVEEGDEESGFDDHGVPNFDSPVTLSGTGQITLGGSLGHFSPHPKPLKREEAMAGFKIADNAFNTSVSRKKVYERWNKLKSW